MVVLLGDPTGADLSIDVAADAAAPVFHHVAFTPWTPLGSQLFWAGGPRDLAVLPTSGGAYVLASMIDGSSQRRHAWCCRRTTAAASSTSTSRGSTSSPAW